MIVSLSTLRVAGGFALGALVTTATSSARADDKAQCIASSEKAQQLRDDRKFLEARELLVACGRAACPGPVRQDCADQLQDLDRRTPTVVVRAKGKGGEDLVDVKVTSDGVALIERLDGRAIPLDPGPHTFRFEAAGSAPVEQKLVVAEGEQNRALTVRFGEGSEVEAGRAPQKRGAPIGAFVVGGLGLVAAGVAPIFYVMGLNEKSDIEHGILTCTTPTCDNEKGDIRAKLAVGDAFMGVGILAVAGGVVWAIVHYTSGSKESAAAPAAMIDFAPTAYGRGGVASATVHF